MSAGGRNLSNVISRLRGVLVATQDQMGQSLHSVSMYDSEFFSTVGDRVDKKSIDRALKFLERALKLSQNPKLGVKKSPPCMSEIIPEMIAVLRGLNFDQLGLSGLDCLTVLVYNIAAKAKQVCELFKTGQLEIFDAKSAARKQLTNLTLRLSHILAELKALFVDGMHVGDKFKITKTDAAQFWSSAFGDNKSVVTWATFEHALLEVQPIESQLEASALRTTIDLCNDGWISIFEFDVFVRLFHPWSTVVKNWNLLAISHPGYVAFLTYDEVKQRLERFIDKPGSYVFRQSCTRLGQWAIGYVTEDGRILQTIPQSTSWIPEIRVWLRPDLEMPCGYKYPDGRNISIDISAALSTDHGERIEVSKEQYEMYCEIGMTFELCKICDENSKDMCIEPCNHLICSACLRGWIDKGSSTCPFCRQEIKGHHAVQIGTFERESSPEVLARETDDDEPPPLDDEAPACNEGLMLNGAAAVRCLCTEGHGEDNAKSACQLAGNNLRLARAILSFVANYHQEESF